MENITDRILKSFQKEKRRQVEKRLYFIVYKVIKRAIKTTEIPSDESLPTSRKLAKELKLSRSTILKAYDLLLLEGYIVSRQNSGYFVKELQETKQVKSKKNSQNNYSELSRLGTSFLKNVNLINTTNDKSVAFRPGIPPLDIFPVNQWKNLTNLYWRQVKASALTYSPSSGNEQLKKNLSNYLNLSRGIKCDSNQIVIVSGSLQSLYLIGSVALNQNDHVAMENPTFPNVHSIFKSLMASIQSIEVDDDGLKTETLKEEQFSKTKLIHTTPSCHYPTSSVLSLKRRKKLLKWANKTGAFIIENDYEHEVTNSKKSLPALFSLDGEDRTIYMGTFNRLLHPSVRLGYMVLPTLLIEPVQALMSHSHRFVPPSIQVVLNQFIEKKYLYNHIKNLIQTAHERKQLFLECFRRHFKDEFIFLNSTHESLHLLGQFKNPEKTESLIQLFAKKHILVHAYSKCFVDGEKKEGYIFGYSSIKGALIEQKIRQMAEIYYQ